MSGLRGKKKRPPKRLDLLDAVHSALAAGTYLDTVHAVERQQERKITRPEYLYVLKNGFHEKSKDTFDEAYHSWNYAIRGKTVDRRDLRVVVTFEEGLLIVTVMEVCT